MGSLFSPAAPAVEAKAARELKDVPHDPQRQHGPPPAGSDAALGHAFNTCTQSNSDLEDLELLRAENLQLKRKIAELEGQLRSPHQARVSSGQGQNKKARRTTAPEDDSTEGDSAKPHPMQRQMSLRRR